MDIKHLQLNTSVLRKPELVSDYIIENEIDIACLHEISYPIDGRNPLQSRIEKEGYNYVEGLHFRYIPNNQNIGTAIASRYPLVDAFCLYYNTDTYLPKEIKESDTLGNVIEDEGEVLLGSRGLKHMLKSRCILVALLDLDGEYIRAVTTHFTVSSLCTETSQMYDMAKMIHSLVKNAKDIPTIFSGDLNLRAQSYSVNLIGEQLTLHSGDLKSTLADDHVAIENTFPEGLAIDHVFSKRLKHRDTWTEDISFSDHKAVLSRFEL